MTGVAGTEYRNDHHHVTPGASRIDVSQLRPAMRAGNDQTRAEEPYPNGGGLLIAVRAAHVSECVDIANSGSPCRAGRS